MSATPQQPISPLRQRMIDDMRMRQFAAFLAQRTNSPRRRLTRLCMRSITQRAHGNTP